LAYFRTAITGHKLSHDIGHHHDVRSLRRSPRPLRWTIYDRQTDEPASVEGRETTGLARDDAEEIADLMNTLALMQKQQTVH
jgi:hypothetical protein